MHVPQSTIAIAEARYLMYTSNHIVSGQTNSPIAGNVQDALVGMYILTNTWNNETDTMIDRHTAYNCYYESNIDTERMINTFKRAEEYYSEYVKDGFILPGKSIPGKLFVSVLFPFDFTYYRTTDTNENYPIVQIERGIVLPGSGPICKKIIGAKGGSAGHILWKEYHRDRAMQLHGEVEFLVYNWMSNHGFSMGISDCITTNREAVIKVLEETENEVRAITASTEDEERRENKINSVLNSAMNIGPTLAKNSMNKGDVNSLNIMRNSGAKGSLINCAQIVAFVGQQNIDGSRVNCTLSGGTRALPHFDPGDNSPIARGMIYSNYFEGLGPAEVYYHAAAGRRGITDTSIKTATTGYIQKRISRLLEDLKACIDGTIRASNGDIVEFMYGDDGMNPKRIYSVRGINHPFFVNPINLARRLGTNSLEEPRTLKEEEIDLLTSFIKAGIPGVQNVITKLTTENICKALRKLLVGVEIAEDKIPEFCREIKDEFESSKVEAGEMVGLIATHAIGSPCTQLTLNSVEWREKLTIQEENTTKNVKIGEWIDNLIDSHKENVQHIKKNRTEYLELDREVYISSPSLDGTISREIITAVTRHLPVGKLVKATTKSGRQITATQAKSFLIWKPKRRLFGATLGSDVKIGDCVPVITKLVKTLDDYQRIKDVILDPIVAIEYVTSDHECVYDLTVPSTNNFCLANGIGCYDTFHSVGSSDVDITMGVPRIDELLRASKTTSTPTCAVFIDDIRLEQNAREIQVLNKKNISLDDEGEEYKKNYDRAQMLKLASYDIVQDFCSNLQEITIEDLLSDSEIMYVSESFSDEFDWKLHASPVNIMTYKEYKEQWWVTLKKNLYGEFDVQPTKWVIILTFDKAKLYKHDIHLSEIVQKIEENTNDSLYCIASPENICQIEIYINFSDVKEYIQNLIDLPPDLFSEELLTSNNIEFFTARDVALIMVKEMHLRGISGISKVYPREDKETKLWVIDTKGSNIVDILGLPGVDIVSTTSNDLYQIYDNMGIEAARTFLFREINSVLGAYGIYINSRHIQLLVDKMTFSGEIASVTERGIGRSVGAVAKLAFERPVDNAILSAVFGENDPINSIAASIMFGKFAKAGTGTVEVRLDESVL